MHDEGRILGRSHGDSERLFPHKTNAYAAATSEVYVNGKALKIWEFQQLETLSNPVLRQRALTIRDAVGEAACPPVPSGQSAELIRWILHMQAEVASQKFESGIPKPGRGCAVPAPFLQEAQERPIAATRPLSPRRPAAPFGPRTYESDHKPKRDHYRDLKDQSNEFADAEHHINLGIQSRRPGGEGKKHITPSTNMVNLGMSTADAQGIQTMKANGEGRKYLSCKDTLAEHLYDMESPAPPARRNPPEPEKHVSHTRMDAYGVGAPSVEPSIGGERRRHQPPPDNMVGVGTSGNTEDPKTAGRRHLDCFAGSKATFKAEHDDYRANWKKDPSRLKGASLII